MATAAAAKRQLIPAVKLTDEQAGKSDKDRQSQGPFIERIRMGLADLMYSLSPSEVIRLLEALREVPAVQELVNTMKAELCEQLTSKAVSCRLRELCVYVLFTFTTVCRRVPRLHLLLFTTRRCCIRIPRICRRCWPVWIAKCCWYDCFFLFVLIYSLTHPLSLL